MLAFCRTRAHRRMTSAKMTLEEIALVEHMECVAFMLVRWRRDWGKACVSCLVHFFVAMTVPPWLCFLYDSTPASASARPFLVDTFTCEFQVDIFHTYTSLIYLLVFWHLHCVRGPQLHFSHLFLVYWSPAIVVWCAYKMFFPKQFTVGFSLRRRAGRDMLWPCPQKWPCVRLDSALAAYPYFVSHISAVCPPFVRPPCFWPHLKTFAVCRPPNIVRFLCLPRVCAALASAPCTCLGSMLV